jgi:hypothetical protein
VAVGKSRNLIEIVDRPLDRNILIGKPYETNNLAGENFSVLERSGHAPGEAIGPDHKNLDRLIVFAAQDLENHPASDPWGSSEHEESAGAEDDNQSRIARSRYKNPTAITTTYVQANPAKRHVWPEFRFCRLVDANSE